jgi:sialate O-acetylesterase
MSTLLRFIVLFFVIISSSHTYAQLRLAQIFSDHIVLQRQKPINIWGWAKNGETVEVLFNGKIKKTTADKSTGKWLVTLDAQEAGGPYEMSIKTKGSTLKLSDILMGDVWVCSGQSNMEWSLKSADNAATEIPLADFPTIRHFEVPREVSFELQDNFANGEWKICTPQNAGDFTAVGYFFAKNLTQKLKVPIGLLHSSWGGSQVEGWISKDAMSASEVLKEYPQTMPKNWEEDAKIWEKKLEEQVHKNGITPSKSEFKESDLLAGKYNTDKFPAFYLPGSYEWSGGWGFRGKAFLMKKIQLSEEEITQNTTLSIGENDNECSIFINGKLIEKSKKSGTRILEIPAGTWQKGQNTLVVKINKLLNPSWFGLGLTGDKSDFFLKTVQQKRSLLEESWHIVPSWEDPYTFAHLNNNVGTTIYNSMIAPIIQFGMKGVIWYQGETNAGRAYQYRESFPLLIKNWRQKWGDEFPFYFVQLSTYGDVNDSNSGSNWAELREAQTMTLKLPKTGMAVTTDIGNQFDIHPTNKKDVGDRLALNALKLTYNQDIEYSSPMYKSVVFQDSKATISFDHVGSGFMVKDKYGYLKGFEIAGEDKKFYFAQAQIMGDKVVVSHPKVTKPVTVRYAWSNAPIEANLFSTNGLPACPFRTDDWKGITVGNVYR